MSVTPEVPQQHTNNQEGLVIGTEADAAFDNTNVMSQGQAPEAGQGITPAVVPVSEGGERSVAGGKKITAGPIDRLPDDISGIPGHEVRHTLANFATIRETAPSKAPAKPNRRLGLKIGVPAVLLSVVAAGAFALTRGNGESETDNQPAPANPVATAPATTPSGDILSSRAPATAAATGEQNTGSTDAQTSAPATSAANTAAAEGSTSVKPGEAIVNPDGTVLLPVEAFKGNPDALAKALITQSLANWSTAGATAEMVDGAFAKVPTQGQSALTSTAHETAQANMDRFADSVYVAGWRNNPELVAAAEATAKDNEAYLVDYIKTANPRNTPGMTTDLNQYDNSPHISVTSDIQKTTLLLAQGNDMTIRIAYTVTNNSPDTTLAGKIPTTSSLDETYSATPEIDGKTGILVYKVAAASNNK